MASIIPARISGIVLGTETREVTRSSDGERFVFRTANILVGGKGCAEVSYRDDQKDALPGEGELVDLLVNVGSYQGSPQFNYYGPFVDAFAPAVKTDLKSA